ncbi:BT4734/BF3469 family protein [Hymenobacter qilianensis]|uniref:BT4734/BF3469 family protein n=1 Tax=Hymenobacter qilianensis TaxID=1385715 RepID=UPI001669A587|nr:BT4734/BF3469 family protein [Hymenobacter qilianensis]
MTLTLAELHGVLVSPRYSTRTKALREATVDTARKAIKKTLDYVTPAGVFSHRANAGVQSLSGLLVLDFDHLPDVNAAWAALMADELLAPGLAMLFTSPSGDGLKAIVWTDPEADHLGNFRGYADYLKAHYAHLGLVPDEAGKDLARACFVPHDPAAWLAPPPDASAAA